ncbi:MAG: hypothetical protein ACFFD5_07190 [Candidatus Thorarchaeota archaeon]
MEYKYLNEIQNDNQFGIIVPVHFNSLKLISAKDFPTEDIFREINHFIFQNGNPDYLWLKIPSDPYLFHQVKFLIQLIKKEYPDQKIGTYINCSILCNEIAQKGLLEYDFIAVNINSIEPSNFGKVNPSCADLSLEDLLEGMVRFKKDYNGHLGIYTIFFSGINDNIDNIDSLKNFLLEIKPDYLSIGNYIGKGFEPVSNGFKKILEENFGNVPFDVILTF